jgi:CheY-like chemotaxis protein/HPt (histidine-containing phosphotransfer) domain-containing protein
MADFGRPLRILVAEDNFVNQQLMMHVLQKLGHEVLLADDGQEAVDLLHRESVDVVLMDVHMPVLDGFEATAAIRAAGFVAKSGNPLPVIALTANAMQGDRERCLAAGMDDYVSKPIEFATLFEAIARYVTPAAKAGALPPADRPAAVHTPATSQESIEQPPVLDEKALRSRAGGDDGLIEFLADAFREDGAQSLRDLEAALESRNGPVLRKAAHTLKGTAANLGGLRVSALAYELEKAAARDDFSRAESMLPCLETAAKELVEALSSLTPQNA